MSTVFFELDKMSAVVHCDAARPWVELETFLRAEGMTLGPIPSWLAKQPIRAVFEHAAMLRPSPFYGALRASVLATEVETGNGIARCPVAPRRAMGPDLPRVAYGRSALTGSITRIALQCWPQATAVRRLGYHAPDWASMEALAKMWRDEGLRPAWWCFFSSDEGCTMVAEVEERGIPLSRWDHCFEANGYEKMEPDRVGQWMTQNLSGEGVSTPRMVCFEGLGLAAAVQGQEDFRVWDVRPDGVVLDGPSKRELLWADWQHLDGVLRSHLETNL